MRSFERDRDLIAALPAQYAKSVLGLLDNGATQAETPAELRVAFAAAQRCPDVARFFLVEKTQKYVDQQSHGGKSNE
jgi:hypothetical protein